MEAVDILRRIDGLQYAPTVDVSGQGKLNEDTIDRIVSIKLTDQSQQLGFTDIAGQPKLLRFKPRSLCMFGFRLHINRTGRIVADQHHRQTRGDIEFGLE
ncbi:hypothetical protein ACM41_13225 [Bradyrhizobium sp. CCBAU 21362]|nr:hypothetical protein [Bradyrhizobium sp. CCBAU 21362]